MTQYPPPPPPPGFPPPGPPAAPPGSWGPPPGPPFQPAPGPAGTGGRTALWVLLVVGLLALLGEAVALVLVLAA